MKGGVEMGRRREMRERCDVVGLYRIREEATESDERLKKGRSELIVVLVR